MLRAFVIGLFAVAAVVFLILGVVVHPYFYLQALGSAVVLVAAIFEARRYRARVSSASSTAGWQDTDEKFVDPTTGRLMRVRYNPATGERDYVEVGPGA
jgi:membrane protein implicated in regulation of membrane protease activity